jgi:hypothetical protein
MHHRHLRGGAVRWCSHARCYPAARAFAHCLAAGAGSDWRRSRDEPAIIRRRSLLVALVRARAAPGLSGAAPERRDRCAPSRGCPFSTRTRMTRHTSLLRGWGCAATAHCAPPPRRWGSAPCSLRGPCTWRGAMPACGRTQCGHGTPRAGATWWWCGSPRGRGPQPRRCWPWLTRAARPGAAGGGICVSGVHVSAAAQGRLGPHHYRAALPTVLRCACAVAAVSHRCGFC